MNSVPWGTRVPLKLTREKKMKAIKIKIRIKDDKRVKELEALCSATYLALLSIGADCMVTAFPHELLDQLDNAGCGLPLDFDEEEE